MFLPLILLRKYKCLLSSGTGGNSIVSVTSKMSNTFKPLCIKKELNCHFFSNMPWLSKINVKSCFGSYPFNSVIIVHFVFSLLCNFFNLSVGKW